jgi:hypothetical protein
VEEPLSHFGQTLFTAAAVLLCLCSNSAAQPASTGADALTVPSWDAFADGLKTLEHDMLARLPVAERNDPQVRQEVGRLMLEAVAARSLEAIAGDGDHPEFVPSSNVWLNILQPNDDTIYKGAAITPGGVYRLRGTVGSDRIASIGVWSNDPNEIAVAAGVQVKVLAYHDLNSLHADAQGRFDVVLSPEKPAGYTGDWWPLDPSAKYLALRQVSSDWAHERDPTITIERLDAPAAKPRESAASLEARLQRLSRTTSVAALAFVDHLQTLQSQGFVNKIRTFNVPAFGQLWGQFYYEGAYDLKDDEALIFHVKVPDKCLYYSTILANEIYEAQDWYNNQSSLNDSQSHVDKDGVLRIVLSAKDPGVPNWLSTAGYPIGVVQGRWNNCSSQPIPTVEKVALADVRRLLPADTPTVTPAQREAIIRERRAEFDQRRLW